MELPVLTFDVYSSIMNTFMLLSSDMIWKELFQVVVFVAQEAKVSASMLNFQPNKKIEKKTT